MTVNGLARCAAVPVVPQVLHFAAVTADTGPPSASYDVDAATMHIQRHERGIHALCLVTGAAGVTDARFRGGPRPARRARRGHARDGPDRLRLCGMALQRHGRGSQAAGARAPGCQAANQRSRESADSARAPGTTASIRRMRC